MGKKKLKFDSPREYDDEFLKAFKARFHDKKENCEMSKCQIGMVKVIEDDDKEDKNEKDAMKRKLREASYL
nr:hypothetical protein [Tanacetum cinerariifolium]